MVDPTSIYVANLIEGFRQLNTYIALGIATAISALTLDSRSMARPDQGPFSVLGGLWVSPSIASLVLLLLSFVVGVMGLYAAEGALSIAELLHGKTPDLLAAACTFPSVVTAPIGIGLIAVGLPIVLSGILIRRVWSRIKVATESRESPGGFIIMLGLFVGVYGLIGSAIVRLPCP
jgi:hypothetical protein